MADTTQRRRGDRRTGVRRDHFVKLSLSDDEHTLLARAAQEQGMTVSGFAAHAALGVARQELAIAPDARQSLIALNDAVNALEALALRIGTDPEPGLLERLEAAAQALEDAGDAVAGAQT
ncbi:MULTISPECIES: hypothetical protein [Nocardiopsis]|uniref:DUF1778 domain-containing protein n=1 Tax=Nocardiopsis changdeensis TaxID=2831969 RepID=A0A975KRZ5_9ACTN|nr:MULTISPECIES: hypothetical protein [Nocardiopsis]QUX26388.1 hypothetical protein KGD84_32330 [Nocardiopsis changdeensis]QUX26400.1 hypothetical protein KGD84_32395 [Nocardiopsis changdeensis]QYX40847.1 hypothetical protein K1J57_33140 [Nocardiopsis sp. MT53]QYX40858.1 hypothetical protein K1J57_33205 [Nocardiopsis sp. MT53]